MSAFDELRAALLTLDKVDGITPINLLDLPMPLPNALRDLTRKGSMSLLELAEAMALPMDEVLQLGAILVDKGYLTSEEQTSATGSLVFRIYFARIRKKNISVDL